ncbi:hypothetical protein GDO86_014660 [Hymenochirus boettgeri]|uniref:Uncharacterized protein n=1 Tax=Hymenochirus boettgeri TaxID=247094 RepID=A0A8T2JPQ0_9PIPI|nr:hypothetical protein GDO86_014660 [Hymenochirus boettgeri]
MNSNKKCEILCGSLSKPHVLTKEQSTLVAERIQEDYYVHLIAISACGNQPGIFEP